MRTCENSLMPHARAICPGSFDYSVIRFANAASAQDDTV
jgi:hypothetical protein